MRLTDAELDDLATLAERFPEDMREWEACFNQHGDPRVSVRGFPKTRMIVEHDSEDYGRNTARYIAAASPHGTLRLIATIRAERCENARLRHVRERLDELKDAISGDGRRLWYWCCQGEYIVGAGDANQHRVECFLYGPGGLAALAGTEGEE